MGRESTGRRAMSADTRGWEMSEQAEAVIRPVRTADYAGIIALWEAAGLPIRPAGRDAEPEFVRQLSRYPSTWLVAETDGRIVGVVLATHDQRKGWINRLAVHPAVQRRGLARRLLVHAEEALHALGIGIIAALVEEGNETSAAVFRAAGYVTDVPVQYFRKRVHPDI